MNINREREIREREIQLSIENAGLPYSRSHTSFRNRRGLPESIKDKTDDPYSNFENGKHFGGSRKIKFIKNNKKYIRTIHIEKDKHYVIFENKKYPFQSLK